MSFLRNFHASPHCKNKIIPIFGSFLATYRERSFSSEQQMMDRTTPLLPLMVDILSTPAVWVVMAGDFCNMFGMYVLLTEGAKEVLTDIVIVYSQTLSLTYFCFAFLKDTLFERPFQFIKNVVLVDSSATVIGLVAAAPQLSGFLYGQASGAASDWLISAGRLSRLNMQKVAAECQVFPKMNPGECGDVRPAAGPGNDHHFIPDFAPAQLAWNRHHGCRFWLQWRLHVRPYPEYNGTRTKQVA